jgi:L-serine dehydratase
MISVGETFKIGIGPSSSHTMGPLAITRQFMAELRQNPPLKLTRLRVELRGSLALTGIGHGTLEAIQLGLLGFNEEYDDPDDWRSRLTALQTDHLLPLGDGHIRFDPLQDIILNTQDAPDLHSNMMLLSTLNGDGEKSEPAIWYSIGGGTICAAKDMQSGFKPEIDAHLPYPFTSAAMLLEQGRTHNLSIDALVRQNELSIMSASHLNDKLDGIISTMMNCIENGLKTGGTLPGGLNVARRAPAVLAKIIADEAAQTSGPVNAENSSLDYLPLYALAVNEENAAGGRVVTAPTLGAAGILPAIMRHFIYRDADDAHYLERAQTNFEDCRKFLLVCGAIASLYKTRASISGAEMGCQGEVGVACSMAAAGLTHFWGGTNEQITVAAEIAMEHNLGLTCDPVGGLVQIPCIERNAIAASKAVAAARLALLSDPENAKVSLDQIIEVMRQTGQDMSSKYKETSQGGLAVNIVAC